MRIDYEYLKDFLEIVLDSPKPSFSIEDEKLSDLWKSGVNENEEELSKLWNSGVNEDEEKLKKLIFHMEILADMNLIQSASGKPGIGFRCYGDSYSVAAMPLRLTADGHQFAADLNKPSVLETLKKTFKDAGPKEVVKLVFSMGRKITDNQLSKLMDE
tara:strand:- start:71 stop:544 length:474 start_codon:yes stop_codon:yes gene_type:complete